MQKQKLKYLVVVLAVLLLDVPRISGAKHHHKSGSATTRGPAPTQAPPASQAPNNEASKLSYSEGQSQHQAQPPQAGWNTNNQPNHAPPPYSANPPSYQGQPGYHQPPPQGGAPVYVNHVQQPQSSGGLGVGSGLAIGE